MGDTRLRELQVPFRLSPTLGNRFKYENSVNWNGRYPEQAVRC